MLAWIVSLVIGLIICIFARFDQNFEYGGGNIDTRTRDMQTPERTLRTVVIIGNEHLDRRVFYATLFGGEPFKAKRLTLEQPEEFVKYTLTQVPREPLIDFIYMYYDIDIKMTKRYYNIACKLKTMLDIDSHRCITDKYSLATNIIEFAPELIEMGAFPRHYSLDNARAKLKEGGVQNMLIIKPSGRKFYGGLGIYVVANNADLDDVLNKLRKLNTLQYAISDYVWNVMTFHDPADGKRKKFHLRGYLLVFPHSRERESLTKLSTRTPNPPPDYCEWDMWNVCKILTARNEYNPRIIDPDITDTHASTSLENYFFPDEAHRISGDPNFPKIIHDQMTEIARTILSFMWSSFRTYAESFAAYEVFGLDFLVAQQADGSPRVVLVEINDRVGMGGCGTDYKEIRDMITESDKRYVAFAARYFKWVFARTVIPFFGGEKITLNTLTEAKHNMLHYPPH